MITGGYIRMADLHWLSVDKGQNSSGKYMYVQELKLVQRVTIRYNSSLIHLIKVIMLHDNANPWKIKQNQTNRETT